MKATVAVFAASLAYVLLFRTYGFQVEDEGTLLFWLDRVARGQLPYVDFHTGYTPVYFYLCSVLLQALGGSANDLRVVVDIVNAATAAGMYALARPLAGAWVAAAAPALWIAFLPVFPGEFASFNVPYPAWFAALAWIALALALVAFSETGRRRDLVVAGAAAAFAFGIKPNAGAFALAAATWSVVAVTRVTGTLDRATGFVAAAVMAVGVWFAFGFAVYSVDALVHLGPLLVLAVLACGPMAGRHADARHPKTAHALAVLAASFLVPTLAWALPVLARLGADGFAREVLLIGSDAAALYYQPHPAPEPYAGVVVAGAVAAALIGRLVRDWRVSPLTGLLLGALACAGVVWAIATFAIMPESALLSVSQQLENSAYWLAPIIDWTGVFLLAAAARRLRPLGDERRLAVLVPCAVAMYWQLYPRTDFMHVIVAAPLTIVLGVWLLARVAAWWTEGAWPDWLSSRAVVGVVLALVVVAVVGLEAGPMAVAGVRCALGAGVQAVAAPRLRVCIEADAADDLVAFGRTAEYLAANAERGEAALPFPATAGLLFAAGLTNPVAHDYWYPGRPSHDDERSMVEALRTNPPRFIATLNDGWTFFTDAPVYFGDLRALARERYRLVARHDRYDVLARNDVAGALPQAVATPATGPIDAAMDRRYRVRLQGVKRWLAGVGPSDAAAAELPDDPARAILLLRALRKGGDMRGAGWLLAGARSTSARVRAEALAAMAEVVARADANRARFAGDFDLRATRATLDPHRREAEALMRTSRDPREIAFAAAVLDIPPARADAAPPPLRAGQAGRTGESAAVPAGQRAPAAQAGGESDDAEAVR